MKKRRLVTAVFCLALVLGLASTATAGRTAKTGPVNFKATLSVGQEAVHPKKTTKGTSGSFTATLTGSTLKWTLAVRQLSTGPPSASITTPGVLGLCKGCLAGLLQDAGKTTGSGTGTAVLTKGQ
ncbi:MAG: hypothetical protein QOF76_5049, partial [Solirubrobacteraceae bacterium]|nr:hypothetical protein [Solirubrobacteraceae bacterium]